MVTGENQPYDHLYLSKRLIPFSANGDHNEMIQNDIFITFFKHLLKVIVVNVKILSQLVRQILFPDMSLVIRYSCRKSNSGMRRTCAIQQAIHLLKVMFRWIQLLAITGERCNDDFMLNLLEIMLDISGLFNPDCLCRSAKNKAKLVIKP